MDTITLELAYLEARILTTVLSDWLDAPVAAGMDDDARAQVEAETTVAYDIRERIERYLREAQAPGEMLGEGYRRLLGSEDDYALYSKGGLYYVTAKQQIIHVLSNRLAAETVYTYEGGL